MQTTSLKLRPAQHEVHRTAHDQDMIEVPKRAMLDRQAEQPVPPLRRAALPALFAMFRGQGGYPRSITPPETAPASLPPPCLPPHA
jgi:hypothetical protein